MSIFKPGSHSGLASVAVNTFTYLFICLRLSVYVSVCFSLHVCLPVSDCWAVSFYLFVFLTVILHVCLFVSASDCWDSSVYLSVCLSICFLSDC